MGDDREGEWLGGLDGVRADSGQWSATVSTGTEQAGRTIPHPSPSRVFSYSWEKKPAGLTRCAKRHDRVSNAARPAVALAPAIAIRRRTVELWPLWDATTLRRPSSTTTPASSYTAPS
jgi:hypothetical protein